MKKILDVFNNIFIKTVYYSEPYILKNYNLTLKLLKNNNVEKIINKISKKKLEYVFKNIALKTPAYISFLKSNKISLKEAKNYSYKEIEKIPFTDKKNYIKKYPIEERCEKGKLPEEGHIDESAGSSGKPTNWPHQYREQNDTLNVIRFEFKYLFEKSYMSKEKKKKKIIVFSAYSSGPWAAGIEFSEISEHYTLVKNTSTNIQDIIDTIKNFGKKYRYIIAAYPLFIERLLEEDFPFKEYDIDIITGGEGYNVLWPEKIKKKLKNPIIISAYGNSDIDIGIAAETFFTKDLRKEVYKNKKLKKALFQNDREETPMIFQYNALMYKIENLENEEFTTTHLSRDTVCPKINYNIHDLGGKITFEEVKEKIKKYSKKLYKKYFVEKDIKKIKNEVLHLPIFYVYGRSDGTISIDGANIFPENIKLILEKYNYDSFIRNFKILKDENSKDIFKILLELKKGKKKKDFEKKKKIIEEKITLELKKINRDYEETLRINKRAKPKIILYNYKKGPFEKEEVIENIKYKYIIEENEKNVKNKNKTKNERKNKRKKSRKTTKKRK